MRTAMAVDASGRIVVSVFHCFGVEATVVGGLLIGVTGGAGNFFRRGFVRGALNVSMAIHAGEHAAVDRVFEGLRIYMQADGLPVHLMRKRGVAVASKAFVNGGLGSFFFRSGLERGSR